MRFFNKLRDLICYIFMDGVQYAKYKGVNIGDSCRIYIRSFGSEPFLIHIGNRVTITSGVRILTHDGSTWLIRDNGVRHQKYLPVTIGNDVFIGVNSIVMPGVKIGSKVVIGAGSIVTNNIPDNSVAVGNPARVISSYEDFEHNIRNTCVSDSELEGFSTYKEKVLYAVKKMESTK